MRLHEIAIVCLLAALSSCLQLQPQTLDVQGRPADHWENKAKEARSAGILVQDFNGDLKGWYGCDGLELFQEGGEVRMELEDATFHCMGGYIKTNDMSAHALVQFKMRAESNQGDTSLTYKVRFEDMLGNETNYDEQNFRMDIGKESKTYQCDFSERLLCVNGDFDSENVVKMKVFFNSKGDRPFTGKIIIDEIRFLPSLARTK